MKNRLWLCLGLLGLALVISNAQTPGNALGASPFSCNLSAPVQAAAVATTQIIPPSGSTTIYVCGFSVNGGGAAGTMQLRTGSGATCATGSVNKTGLMTTAIGQNIDFGNGTGVIFKSSPGDGVCVQMATASATAAGIITYAQY